MIQHSSNIIQPPSDGDVMRELRNFMSVYFKILRIGVALLVVAPLACGPVRAAQQLVLVSDQTQIIKLPVTPATIVVGNPAVADVTTEGSSLFFHPRGFGLTNVIALDDEGKKIGDYVVRVVFEDSYSVSMYAPGGRQTFSCRKDCEATMRLGDGTGFVENYAEQFKLKNGLVRGQALGDTVTTQDTTNTIITTAPIR
jgi:hypothetical protein